MRISHQHRFVFLANPRTGSTTVRKILDDYSDVRSVHITEKSEDFPFYDHISAAELKAIFEAKGWEWTRYRKFCMVRNPFDRVVSLYHLHQEIMRQKVKGKNLPQKMLRYIKRMLIPLSSFQDYVMHIDPEARLSKSLRAFICDKNGECLVEDVLMYENMKDELPKYLDRYGINICNGQIPHMNASISRTSYRDYYNDYTRKRVELLYDYEINRFGYLF